MKRVKSEVLYPCSIVCDYNAFYAQVSVLSMAVDHMKDVWRYSMMDGGALCVMMHLVSLMQM